MVGNENLCNVIESFRTGINGKHIHPPIIAIEPTSKCNMDCIMCPNSEVENKVMNHRLFTSIISQIKNYAKAILFYYRGEPLLNPDLSKMINYASSETDAKLFLSTNGSLLDKKNSMDIIKSGLDEIIISLDAYSPQTFAKIKGRNELTSIKNNVLRLVKINKKYDNKLDIAVKMISMVSNENEVEKFRDYWQNKVDRVEISKSNIILNLLSRNKMNFGGRN